MSDTAPTTRTLPNGLASAIVFLASGTVLVLEILGVRLMAPYVGSSLDTYTAIIGTVLAGISVGTYVGGRLADRMAPSLMLGPTLMISGALTLLIIPAIRALGPGLAEAASAGVVVLSAVGLLLPAAVLSAVSPIVVKLQLSSLQTSGATVGRLSAIGTAGAIAGTFLAGFVLLAYFRSSAIVLSIGLTLLLGGLALTIGLSRAKNLGRATGFAAMAMLVGVPLTAANGSYCSQESRYYCMRLIADEARSGGQYLALDSLLHSYVDQDDPEFLKFWYIQAMAASFDALVPDADVKTLAIGGGGFTVPRYLEATRSTSSTTALEIDPALVSYNREELGLRSLQRLEVVTGDARSTIRKVEGAEFDLVVADAFGNESVPWHLSTVEFAGAVKRTMASDGLLVMNVIDYGDRKLLKAEMKTLRQVFPHVALVERRSNGSFVAGNFVVLASSQPIDQSKLVTPLAALGETSVVVVGAETEQLYEDAPVLTDDFAPADQLLADGLRQRVRAPN